MHQTILLVTPVLRFNNLKHILANIKSVFQNEKDITPEWVLCIDKYNCTWTTEGLNAIVKECLDSKIKIAVYYQGKPGCNNYGGALMNEPLKHMKVHYFKDKNPLMIVLDDDNVLSKNIITFIHTHCMNDENNVWILNMLSECGDIRYSRSLDFLTGRVYGKYKIYHTCATIDPSQVLFRLDLFLSIGGFSDGIFYDFDMMTKFDHNVNGIQHKLKFQMDECVPRGLPSRNGNFYVSSYHNGLITDEMIKKTIDDIQTSGFDDSYIRVHVNNNYYNVPLTNEKLKEILESFNDSNKL